MFFYQRYRQGMETYSINHLLLLLGLDELDDWDIRLNDLIRRNKHWSVEVSFPLRTKGVVVIKFDLFRSFGWSYSCLLIIYVADILVQYAIRYD